MHGVIVMEISWAVTREKIEQAVKRIIRFEQPRRVVLFGSAAHGNATLHSDADILVVTKKEVDSSRKESVRIRRQLRGISMPMDILVISENRLKALADHPGLIYREALRHGKVLYEAAA